MKLHNYTIMPLDTDHLEEICQDIRHQYENGTATCALFMMTLVPEGNPPVDKVGILCEKYDRFRDRLAEMGLGSGILVQATIGHGWVLSEMFPFQPYTGINTGTEVQIVCPYDEGFRDYIRNAFRVIASHHPDTVMVDDDFRLMSFRSFGCGCPTHVRKFNELWGGGASFTREEIWELLHRNDADGDRANEIFTYTQHDAMLGAARLMRAGLDEIDPALPGSFCCVGNNVECAADIADILAGEDNPRIVRINNGHYTAPSNHAFSDVFYRAAQSIAKLADKTDVILAETDTCPQNRYSTSAMSLHTHFTGTILEGARGAKHWITRLHAFEPESGRAYRHILGKYRGFYETLADLVPHLSHRGCCIPLSDTPNFDLRKTNRGNSGWSSCVLERLGLPMFFSAKPHGVVCLSGAGDAIYSDEELKTVLSGTVFLASDTAKRLCDRGFADDIGVDVHPWTGKQPSLEILPFRNNVSNVQVGAMELVPRSPDVVEHSTVYHSVDKVHYERLFPGVTVYHNNRGGTAVVFCGTPVTNYSLTEAFSFLSYSRKQQLLSLMQDVGELPLYTPEDAEIYFRCADMDDGRRFCAVFNLGQDPIDALTLVSDRPVTKIEVLEPDGTFRAVPFAEADGVLTLDLPCLTLTPVVLVVE
ncbi:MAG: hypothetical protein IJ449_05775 [Clostridia bacterium]|nr:hypothetical protein [Clostridia bacterium]